jgi:hypothetical protein
MEETMAESDYEKAKREADHPSPCCRCGKPFAANHVRVVTVRCINGELAEAGYMHMDSCEAPRTFIQMGGDSNAR